MDDQSLLKISEEQFQALVNHALQSLKSEHVRNIRNVAILYQEDPTPQQRQKLALRDDQTLFGLYEGIPLSQRQGQTPLYPDKITIFKGPMVRSSATLIELRENIRHTLWHEIGHYYGLDHKRIAELE